MSRLSRMAEEMYGEEEMRRNRETEREKEKVREYEEEEEEGEGEDEEEEEEEIEYEEEMGEDAPNTVINEDDHSDEVILEYSNRDQSRAQGFAETENTVINESKMSTTSTVQEVVYEKTIEKSPDEASANGSVSNAEIIITTVGNNEKVADPLGDLLNVLKEKYDFVKDYATENIPEIHLQQITPELKDYAKKACLGLLVLLALFSSVVLFRVGRSFYSLEDTYVCHFLSSVDHVCSSSLAPTLCTPFHEDFYTEFGQESTKLVHQIGNGISSVCTDVYKGIGVMFHLFTVFLSSIGSTIWDGLYELWDNMTDNLYFLVDFISRSFHFIIDCFVAVWDGICCSLYSIYRSIRGLYVQHDEGFLW